MTVQALADRCAENGVPLDRTVITKLEKGRRQHVAVPELLVLARSLEISPLMLIFPVGTAGAIEALPGHAVPPFDAAQWFSGEQPWPGGAEAERDAWRSGSFALIAYREHSQLVLRYDEDLDRAESFRRTALETAEDRPEYRKQMQDSASAYTLEAGRIEGQLRYLRKDMRDRGITPPELPAHLRHVDSPVNPEVG